MASAPRTPIPIKNGKYIAEKNAINVQNAIIKNALETSWAGAGNSGFLINVKISSTTPANAPESSQPVKFEIGTA